MKKKAKAQKHKSWSLLYTLLFIVLIVVAVFIILCYMTPTEEEYYRNDYSRWDKRERIEGLEIPSDPFNGEIIEHTGYTLSYSEEYEVPIWVGYELTKDELFGSVERKDAFRQDPYVSTGSAILEDYRKSGYDRGHLAPAADFKWSEEAMSETFYLSNMTPQNPSFNKGIWADLEDAVRAMALENESVYVVTGPVLTDGPYETIGVNEVAVPKNFYKVILDYNEPEIKAIGFIIPNEKSNKSIAEYAMSVDDVEEITQIDFFPLLNDEEESIIEERLELYKWPLRAFLPEDYEADTDTSYVIENTKAEEMEMKFSDWFFIFKNNIFELTGTKDKAKRIGLI